MPVPVAEEKAERVTLEVREEAEDGLPVAVPVPVVVTLEVAVSVEASEACSRRGAPLIPLHSSKARNSRSSRMM